MIVAVTGASGFIGRHLCVAAERAGAVVRRVDRESLYADGLARKLVGADVIVHLAARAHVLRESARDPEAEFARANLELPRRVGAAAKRAGVQRFIFLSSAGVLGSSSGSEALTDESPTNPHDIYTRSKLAAELALRGDIRDHLDLVIVRPTVVYGPGAPGNFGRLVRAAASGWPLPVGRADAPRSLLGVRNLCDFVLRVASAPTAQGGSYLVADRETTTVAELARMVAGQAGRKAWLLPVPPWLLSAALVGLGRRRDVGRLLAPFVVRSTAASSDLGWSPPYRLAEEIAWTLSVDAVR